MSQQIPTGYETLGVVADYTLRFVGVLVLVKELPTLVTLPPLLRWVPYVFIFVAPFVIVIVVAIVFARFPKGVNEVGRVVGKPLLCVGVFVLRILGGIAILRAVFDALS